MAYGPKPRPLIDRLMAKVSPEPNSGCWLWTGALARNSYGTSHEGRRTIVAHRLFYKIFKGEIPDGLVIDHKCRVRCCVNPDHLEPVTMRENIMRGVGPDRNRERKTTRTHCIHGHPTTPENLYVRGDVRSCIPCNRIRSRDWYRNNKAVGRGK